MFQQSLSCYRDYALTLLRIVAGLLFMQHGMQKLFGLLSGFGGTPGAYLVLTISSRKKRAPFLLTAAK